MKDATTPDAQSRPQVTSYEAYVERLVAEAPPLTEEQRGRIRALLRGHLTRRVA